MSSTPPRYFGDLTVPLREDGSPLLTCKHPDDYEIYIRWLADYLHGADLPLSPEQEKSLAQFHGEPGDLVFYCSDTFGYDAEWLDGIDNHIKDGKSYCEFKDFMEPHWREFNVDFENPEDQWSFEDFLGIAEADYNNRIVEIEQMGVENTLCDHADIPFRSLLCHALRLIPYHDERYREMDAYFRNFNDNASK